MHLSLNKSSPGASSTGYALPASPSLQSDEVFRQRITSPRMNQESSTGEKSFPEKNTIDIPPSPQSPKSILGLRSKLSQSWIEYAIISLIIITIRLFISIKSIGPLVERAKDKAISSCSSLELTASAVVSLPHIMAGGFNRATVDSVNLAIRGFAKTIDLSLVAIEGIITWLIHVYKRTYLCLLEFAVRGSIGALSESVKVLGLDALNENIPSMDEIETKISDLASVPFNELRGIVKDAVSDIKFNQSVLPIPPKNQVKFCADNLNLDIFDEVSQELIKGAYIGIGILIAIILLMIVINMVIIWLKNKKTGFRLIRMEDIFIWITKRSKNFKNNENKDLFIWFWHYILHKPALICLLIGLTGVLGIYLQIFILNTVKQINKQTIVDSINDFSNSIANLIDSQLISASKTFSNDSNTAILSLENDLNQNLFGWVNTTTNTLNNTLNAAVDEISTFVQNTFGGVPILLTSVNQLVDCLILNKIEGIQAGLNFISENAFIGLPRVNEAVLSDINNDMNNFVVGQATNELVGSSNNDGEIGGEIGKIFDAYEETLRSELLLFWCLISVWLIVIFMALIGVLWELFQRRRRKQINIREDNDNSHSKPKHKPVFSQRDIINPLPPRPRPPLPPKPIIIKKHDSDRDYVYF
ncbi:17893_t:CDS:2 [Funneliformis geosporum]|uniref:Plasma membrane fusion protein PRM1 n=1 Tax=Funneliformis geosporum TaxID=1117311 RepID=A0A9W4WMU8_9GLOM|nr:17893_t:CDS:2 [Funneliformis geosporum]CAI2173185.1 17570_t:CDS:2 [Funneliformis geosporum]